jgi:hypothetical protein
MMSLSAIEQLNEEIAAEAAAEGRYPFVVDSHDIERWRRAVDVGEPPGFPFPNLGYHEPEGWVELERMFVDATGWDLYDAGGPAMSIAEFVNALEPGFGYAIVETGQFQVYIGKFEEV